MPIRAGDWIRAGSPPGTARVIRGRSPRRRGAHGSTCALSPAVGAGRAARCRYEPEGAPATRAARSHETGGRPHPFAQAPYSIIGPTAAPAARPVPSCREYVGTYRGRQWATPKTWRGAAARQPLPSCRQGLAKAPLLKFWKVRPAASSPRTSRTTGAAASRARRPCRSCRCCWVGERSNGSAPADRGGRGSGRRPTGDRRPRATCERRRRIPSTSTSRCPPAQRCRSGPTRPR